MSKLDVITMMLIQDKLNIPLDILRYLNKFIYEELNDNTIREAINLWIENKELCLFKFGQISNWNTSEVTDMNWLFSNKINFNCDISRWNVSNVTNMSYMFYGAYLFNQDLNNWNVSKVTNMIGMFWNATSFDRNNINQWDLTMMICLID